MNFLARDAVHLSWFTGPIAIDTGSKTHAISTNEDGDIEVHQLVHSTGAVTTTELEATFGSSGNDHSPCAVAELGSGKLISLWTEAGTGPITYKISTNVDDSTAWGSAQTLGSGHNHSYAKVIRLTGEGSGSGRIYVFTRTPDSPKRQQYYYSDDDASTWNGPYDLARCIAADELSYCVFSSNGVDRIDVFSSVVESSGSRNREDVYHFYLQDEEAFASDGTSLGTRGDGDFPLTVENDCTQVYDSSTGDEAWVWDCVTDGDQPAVVFATFPDRDTNHDYYWAKYDSVNDDWNDLYKVADAGGLIVSPSVTENHYSGGICFDGNDPDAVYASIGDHTSGCRLVRMTRSGSTWSEDFTVCGSPGNYIQNIRPVVPVTTGTVSARCKLLWVHAGIYNDQDSYSSDVMYLSDAEEVSAAGWSSYIDYTIASGQVTGGLDTNGLMAAMITHANLTGANATAFWAGVQNGGADIRACVSVVDDGNGDFTAEHTLPVDVYYCDTSTEKLKMRVCLPVAYEGLEINILFGNSGASANTDLIGHDSAGFPGAEAVWTPRLYAMVPDFTVASGSITDRSSNGKTLTVRGTPDYAQTDQWGGPGAMYFTGADDDMAYAEELIGRGAMVLITPDLEATTENAEIWFIQNGNSSVGGRYMFGRIDDLTAPHDAEAYTVGGSGNTAVRDDESFTGFVQVHAALPINNSDVSSHLQVNDRTEQTAATGNIGTLNSTAINGLRTPSFIPRGRATYHEEWLWAPSRFPDSDALDTYWANHEDPASFWDEGTVVEMSTGEESDIPAATVSLALPAPSSFRSYVSHIPPL